MMTYRHIHGLMICELWSTMGYQKSQCLVFSIPFQFHSFLCIMLSKKMHASKRWKKHWREEKPSQREKLRSHIITQYVLVVIPLMISVSLFLWCLVDLEHQVTLQLQQHCSYCKCQQHWYQVFFFGDYVLAALMPAVELTTLFPLFPYEFATFRFCLTDGGISPLWNRHVK